MLWLTLLGWLHAAVPDDLTGRWVLDLEASDALDPLLVAAGLGWTERQIAAHNRVVQDIRVQDQALVIDVSSLFQDRTEVLPLNGEPTARTNRLGQPMAVRTYTAGEAVITVSDITTEDGSARMEMRRTLEDGGATLRTRVTYTPPGGAPLSADRLYRREPP